MTPAMAVAVVTQRGQDLFVKAHGLMSGRGESWLNGSCEHKACTHPSPRVQAIQPAP